MTTTKCPDWCNTASDHDADHRGAEEPVRLDYALNADAAGVELLVATHLDPTVAREPFITLTDIRAGGGHEYVLRPHEALQVAEKLLNAFASFAHDTTLAAPEEWAILGIRGALSDLNQPTGSSTGPHLRFENGCESTTGPFFGGGYR